MASVCMVAAITWIAYALYSMSRGLLFIDRGQPVGEQLARLIADIFGAAAVGIWNAYTAKLDVAGSGPISEDGIRQACRNGNPKDDRKSGRFIRTLSLGSRRLGTLYLIESSGKRIEARSADAIALERDRSFLAESSAEASRQTEQLRSAVLDGLAHAFKTPLATIQAASSGLIEIKRLEEVEEELVATIQSETQHLADLTTPALQTGRLDDKLLKVKKERIFVSQFLHADWSRLVRGLDNHELEIEANDPTRVVFADPRLLQMALSQLLDNASKYAEPASPIQLSVAVTVSETILSVHNRGSYIFPEEGERNFQRFYRSPDSRYRAPGTGIGLTVARQIAEAHLGHVWMES